MGARMRDYPWQDHPLGPPSNWPQSLKTNIRLILNSGFPMFIWWSDELFSFHNDAYLPALGNKHPQALGLSARVVWAEVWDDLHDIVAGVLHDKKPFTAEALKLILQRKNFAEETYWTFSYSPAFNDAGEVNGIFCACFERTSTILGQRRLKTLKDISDTSTQNQTLKQACQSACDFLNKNADDIPFSLIYLLNGEGTKAHLSGQAGLLHFSVPKEVDLHQQNTLWPLEVVQQTKQAVVVNFPDGIESSVDNAHLPPVKIQAVLPICMPGQEQLLGFFIVGISSWLEYDTDYKGFQELLANQIATTITHVQAREELARQQVYLNEIFEQAPVGITLMRGQDFIIDLANPSICDIWGRKQEEVLGKPVLEALPEIGRQNILQLLRGVLETGEPFVANELPVVLERNGRLEVVYLNFVYHPKRNSYGAITGVIAVAIDINEQVGARREIEQMNKELLAINADLDNFVYSASHDLKAPISNIEGLLKVLVEYLPDDMLELDVVQRLIGLIENSIDRFKKAVADLTEVAKIQREAGEDVKQVDLAEIISEVQLDFESLIIESGARIELDIAPVSSVRFSAKNMRSVIYNLLSNALKYRSPERRLHISISTEVLPEYTLLTVTDNGLGVNPTEKEKMFSMFKRLHDHVEGSGIGLYIVKRIMENAGGKIEVESKLGEGAAFKVYFQK
ncbi:PAS domain-containing protein [Pontibacter qinzhouensis]|uniref:histidine kinase n=2 Tax=Pontibacter qinzhouensis TaxID=2603253 RepID=A0A5C8IV38_9BACT|nr:PAS domain-containing protein [Pontibacter qinzhouensis]